MNHSTGTRSEWNEARRDLLVREKELTRMSDAVAQQRLELPWVRVDEPYVFDTENGPQTLAELFGGRSQLIVYHFMFGPDWDEGCPSCSSLGDHIDLPRVHLEHHDVAWVAVSRAPLEKLLAYRSRMGWSFPWVSSLANNFNFDFKVSSTDERPLLEYNFREVTEEMRENWPGELPGMSTFVVQDGVVYHTYSAFARGLDAMWGMYQWLDRAPLGRNEQGANGGWMRRHDSYVSATA